MSPVVIFALIVGASVFWAVAKKMRGGMPVPVLPPALSAVMVPHRKGDYQASLEAAEGLRRRGEVTASYCFHRGSNLAHLGRLEEAEMWLRRNIAMHEEKREKRFLAIGFSSLGHLMLQAGRFDEAGECFTTSMRHFPGRASGYRSMAELLLWRGGSPAEAARWAKQAIDREQADRQITEDLRKLNLGEDLATLAWATAAESHNASEVARLVEEAVASVGASNVQSTAQVHYLSGRASSELGDRASGTTHYQEAARIDLQGYWGRVARAALRSPENPTAD